MKIKALINRHADVYFGDITVGNVYRVIGICDDWFTIMSDEGLPYSYPPELFTVTDSTKPTDWTKITKSDGRYSEYPESLHSPGFFENYFDGDRECRVLLRKRLQKWREGED